MTYERLLYLKFRRGISTYELMKRYPRDIKRVSEVALLDIPEETLKEIIPEDKVLNRIIRLKKKMDRQTKD
ncbi:MAG TPA: hypothetical protein VL688_01605 [Verrucomicrobiae bacterium]|jgi:hypothetical protein|nr:hypothetical protein [Verrucomicrobiae bacterium]